MPDSEEIEAYVVCDACTLIYHNPVKTRQEFSDFYRSEYSADYHESRQMQEDIAEDRLDFLRSCFHPQEMGRLLEIGCSIGSFLSSARREGYQVEGVEPSEQFVAKAKEFYGLEVTNCVYEDVRECEKKYQIISLFHVLEHMVNPVENLTRMHRELTDDGIVYIVVPTFKEHQLSMVFKPIHPTVFTEDTLRRLLVKTGFSVDRLVASGSNILAIATKKEAAEPVREIPLPSRNGVVTAVTLHLRRRSACISLIRQRLSEINAGAEVAIYGSGHTLIDMNAIYALDQINVTRVFDSDQEKVGKKVLAYTVESGEGVGSFTGEYIVIASYAYQEEIAAYLKEKVRASVSVVLIYDKENR